MPTSMSRRMRCGSVTSHGRGPTEAPWKTPNSSDMGAGYSRVARLLTSANTHLQKPAPGWYPAYTRSPFRYGPITRSLPSSFRSFNELLVPLASSTTYVSFVPVGPAKLSPEAGSEDPIL